MTCVELEVAIEPVCLMLCQLSYWVTLSSTHSMVHHLVALSLSWAFCTGRPDFIFHLIRLPICYFIFNVVFLLPFMPLVFHEVQENDVLYRTLLRNFVCLFLFKRCFLIFVRPFFLTCLFEMQAH